MIDVATIPLWAHRLREHAGNIEIGQPLFNKSKSPPDEILAIFGMEESIFFGAFTARKIRDFWLVLNTSYATHPYLDLYESTVNLFARRLTSGKFSTSKSETITWHKLIDQIIHSEGLYHTENEEGLSPGFFFYSDKNSDRRQLFVPYSEYSRTLTALADKCEET